jgi:hypothetical protein
MSTPRRHARLYEQDMPAQRRRYGTGPPNAIDRVWGLHPALTELGGQNSFGFVSPRPCGGPIRHNYLSLKHLRLPVCRAKLALFRTIASRGTARPWGELGLFRTFDPVSTSGLQLAASRPRLHLGRIGFVCTTGPSLPIGFVSRNRPRQARPAAWLGWDGCRR